MVLASSCSRPVANFYSETKESQAPITFNFVNESQNAEKYEWYVNDSLVGNQQDLTFRFIESGRKEVELRAHKGDSYSSKSKEVFIEAPLSCHVIMNTNKGDLILELSEDTPAHQKNFIDLVNSGFYNGMKFHRIMDGFMIQAGDPLMREEPYKKELPSEFDNEIHDLFFHTRGALAAARMPDNINPEKKSSGTQFYIVDGRKVNRQSLEDVESGKLFDYKEKDFSEYLKVGGAPQLDGEYTVFGHLVCCDEVLEEISRVKTGERDKPIEDVIIFEAKVIN